MTSAAADEAARLIERVGWWGLAAAVAWYGCCVGACVAARLRPGRTRGNRLTRFAPACVRRWAGIACTASIVLTPQVASAAEPSRPAVVVVDEPVVRVPVTPVPPDAVPAAVVPPPPSVPASSNHVVLAGDNLWFIARAALGANASESEVAHYWRNVIDANRATLRSGNPNLIYPGEVVVLPATT